MNVGATFKSNAKAAKCVHPSVSALNDPTHFPETATVWHASFGNSSQYAIGVKDATIAIKVIPAICEDTPWFAQWPAEPASNGGNCLD